MRLLNTATKKLKSFNGIYVPRYAILSHTWGKDEDEVSFSDIVDSDDARREGIKGYAKIVGACKQAIEDGWDYIWVDTCCINKESSAELSEAINSMYKWYQEAEVCYVYLEDVYSGGYVAEDIEMDGSGEEDDPIKTNRSVDGPSKTVPFERSRWFSRGWTLQELIAPRFIVFYSADWIDIGTRASLQDVISATTRIRVEMLVAYDPKKASVAERMSWAAFRETTRVEDMAYCLMGLFGVNMPLLYGEGNRAFRRLQEEIMKVSDDHSLFAWKGDYKDYTNLNDVYIATRGLLANTPQEFRDGMNIAPSSDGAFSPYSMTNQGLQIQLPFEPINPKYDLIGIRDTNHTENVFKATLKCTIRDKQPARWIVIYLKKIRDGHYERAFVHLLDETEINPNNAELTSLLVPQIDTSTTNVMSPESSRITMKTLPTESGFTTKGHSLVKGYEHPEISYYNSKRREITDTVFDGPEGECFAVVTGSKDGVFWLDVVDVTEDWDPKNAYKEGGDRYNKVLKHLDRLSVEISNWSVVVSAKKFNRGHFPTSVSYVQVTVDIQREAILARGWYVPSLTPISDRFDKKFIQNYFYGNYVVHPDFKKECGDWNAIFNPKIKRTFDVSAVHSIMYLPDSSCSSSVRLSPDGTYLAMIEYLGTVKVYDTNTGEPCDLFFGQQEDIDQIITTCVCFSPDGKFLATGHISGKIKLWDIEKGHDHKLLFSDNQDEWNSLCFSPDGRLIVSGSSHGIIKIWDIVDETSHIFTMDNPKSSGGFPHATSCNGSLVAGGWDGTVWIWDIATKQLVKKLEEYRVAVFTQDGEGLVIGGYDGLGSLGYLNAGKLVPVQAMGKMEGYNDSGTVDGPMLVQGETSQWIIPEADQLPVTSIAASHDGHWAIVGLPNGCVEFWDLKNATVQFMLQGHVSGVDSVDMSSAGNILATSSFLEGVRIWRYDPI